LNSPFEISDIPKTSVPHKFEIGAEANALACLAA
jgi:hypothetical protein